VANDDVLVYLVGDVRVESENPEEVFALCASQLREADILFGNLETVISDRWHAEDVSDLRLVGTPERMLAGYVAAGFSVLNVANNPSMRFGWSALSRCMELLDGSGVAHIGAGANLDEARKPAILERNGTKVAFLGYSTVTDPAHAARKDRPGVNRFRVDTAYRPPARFFEVPGSPPIIVTTPDARDLAALQENIRDAKQQADVVIVSWHWGISPASGGQGELVDYQVTLGHACIDAGANLVVGHHPHLLQGVEVYQGKAIFYSLGDFTPRMTRATGAEPTIIAKITIGGKAVQQVAFIPGEINEEEQPVLLSAGGATDAGDRIESESERFGTPFDRTGDEVLVQATDALQTL
jgi:poly-gamma-glutamate capsule biosynthesis protein CapA/YwtB (metallophosphatase superfamily)